MSNVFWFLMVTSIVLIVDIVLFKLLFEGMDVMKCYKKTIATIIGYNELNDPVEDTIYAPIFEYIDKDGNKRVNNQHIFLPSKKEIGSKVEIFYHEKTFRVVENRISELIIFPAFFIVMSNVMYLMFLSVTVLKK